MMTHPFPCLLLPCAAGVQGHGAHIQPLILPQLHPPPASSPSAHLLLSHGGGSGGGGGKVGLWDPPRSPAESTSEGTWGTGGTFVYEGQVLSERCMLGAQRCVWASVLCGVHMLSDWCALCWPASFTMPLSGMLCALCYPGPHAVRAVLTAVMLCRLGIRHPHLGRPLCSNCQ